MKTKSIKGVAIVVAAIAAAAAIAFGVFRRGLPNGGADTPFFTVVRGPLDITVTTPGTIQSRHSEIVRSKAQGRNAIIWIIEEGRTVTNGQLIVELDSSELDKQLTDQQIVVGNSEAALLQSREKLAIA